MKLILKIFWKNEIQLSDLNMSIIIVELSHIFSYKFFYFD